MIPEKFDESDSNNYRFLRSLPPGSLPFRKFTVRPRDEVTESSGWAWFGMGVLFGAWIISSYLAVMK